MLITRFFRKLSILKQADIFLPFKTAFSDRKLTWLKPVFYNKYILKTGAAMVF